VSHTFQVDLRGIVDLLSHHLYGSPRVYVRELLQNAVDAISARTISARTIDDRTFNDRTINDRTINAPMIGDRGIDDGDVTIETPEITGDGTLRVHDNGIGLTEAQVHELLATIGRSSKRDELGFARHEFLGQFGIGLLSCFVVADRVEVRTRAADSPTVRWVGHADGRYEVSLPTDQRSDQGTTVILHPRRDTEQWLTRPTVTELARLYGSLLPVSIRIAGASDGAGSITEVPPWLSPDRARAVREFAHAHVGVEPFDTIELHVPEAGLVGLAYILPVPVNPIARGGHRVYLKRMLLAENATGLLPEWAFFARAVVDATELRPTANREALYEDSLLETVRESIGDQLRGWLVRLASSNPAKLDRFLQIHNLGVKAMALHDDAMLRLVEQSVRFETNVGPMTLAEFRARYGRLRYTATIDAFRQLAGLAAAQDVAVINAGYIYEADIIERLPLVDNSIRAERLDPAELATLFESLDPGVELGLRPFLAAAQRAMDPLGCEVVLRSFEPAGMAATYLLDRDASFRSELRETRDKADPLWAGVLDAFEADARDVRPQLVLNYRNPLVRRVSLLVDPAVIRVAVEALYGQALLLGYHPIRPADAALLNRSFLSLLERAVPGTDQPGGVA
jgi:molecular chaperone HtpG